MHLTTDKFNPYTKKMGKFYKKNLCEKYKKKFKIKRVNKLK